jgi:hypothetical protein
MFFYFTKKKHLKLLNEFEYLINTYFNSESNIQREELKQQINKLAPTIKRITISAGTYIKMTASFRAAGQPDITFCPFDHITESIYGQSPIRDTINMIQRTIGLYESGEIKKILSRQPQKPNKNINNNKNIVLRLFRNPIVDIVIGGLILAFIIYCFFPQWIGLDKLPCYSTHQETEQISA